jgi:maltooligosyltrehalose trehalohydrolase
MGEEFADTAPFLFFTSYGDPALARAVAEGRFKEFEELARGGDFADPQAVDTFERSRITWSLLDESEHATPDHNSMLRLYRDLIALRKRWPCLGNGRKDLTRVNLDEQARWLRMDRGDPSGCQAALLCNFSPDRAAFDFDEGGWQLALSTSSAGGNAQSVAGHSALLYVR